MKFLETFMTIAKNSGISLLEGGSVGRWGAGSKRQTKRNVTGQEAGGGKIGGRESVSR